MYILTLSFILFLISASVYSETDCSVDIFKNSSGIIITKDQLNVECEDKRCIPKCCIGNNKIFFGSTARPIKCYTLTQLANMLNLTEPIILDYTVQVYEGSTEEDVELVTRNLMEDYHIVHNSKLSKNACVKSMTLEPEDYYIFSNGSLVAVRPNYYKIFISHWDFNEYCYEHLLVQNVHDGSLKKPFITFKLVKPTEIISMPSSSYPVHKPIVMILSCIFLLLVLIVYAITPDVHKIQGWMVMAYCSTVLVAFLLRVIMLLGNIDRILEPADCKVLGIFLYYATLSVFFWMNITSVDIWWTFVGIYKIRDIHRKGELVKFSWYALYAWGTPFLMAVVVGSIDYADLSHNHRIFKPHFENCFYMNDDDGVVELRYYLYAPILVLLLLDVVFFVLTAFNIWRIKRDIDRFRNQANNYNNNSARFGVYFKLALVMGISWILETVPLPESISMVADVYNGLTGVLIFIIFVCKRNIFLSVCERLKIDTKLVRKVRRRSSAAATSGAKHRKKSSVEETSMTNVERDEKSTLKTIM